MARKQSKKTCKILDQVTVESAARRLVWIEQGCPQFKCGRTKDQKKEASRTACRGRYTAD